MSDFGYAVDSNVFVPLNEANAIEIFSSASTNTKGSWTEIYSSTPIDIDVLWIALRVKTFGSTGNFVLMDLGIGSSGNEVVLVPNLSVSNRGAGVYDYGSMGSFYLPTYIPAGTRLSARIQSNESSLSCYVGGMSGIKANRRSRYSTIIDYGTTIADSKTTALPRANSSAFTYGAWVEITPSIQQPTEFLLVCAQLDNTSGGRLQLGIGGAGSEQAVVDSIAVIYKSCAAYYLFPCSLPAGVRLAGRCGDSVDQAGNTNVALYCACWGISP